MRGLMNGGQSRFHQVKPYNKIQFIVPHLVDNCVKAHRDERPFGHE
jgi:hypothetical protein